MNNKVKNIAFWLIAGTIVIMAYSFINRGRQDYAELNHTQFMDSVEKGLVKSVVIKGNNIKGEYLGKVEEFDKFKLYTLVEYEFLKHWCSCDLQPCNLSILLTATTNGVLNMLRIFMDSAVWGLMPSMTSIMRTARSANAPPLDRRVVKE